MQTSAMTFNSASDKIFSLFDRGLEIASQISERVDDFYQVKNSFKSEKNDPVLTSDESTGFGDTLEKNKDNLLLFSSIAVIGVALLFATLNK